MDCKLVFILTSVTQMVWLTLW